MSSQYKFQFLSRNSVRWDEDDRAFALSLYETFQFLSRNSVRWDQRFSS